MRIGPQMVAVGCCKRQKVNPRGVQACRRKLGQHMRPCAAFQITLVSKHLHTHTYACMHALWARRKCPGLQLQMEKHMRFWNAIERHTSQQHALEARSKPLSRDHYCPTRPHARLYRTFSMHQNLPSYLPEITLMMWL